MALQKLGLSEDKLRYLGAYYSETFTEADVVLVNNATAANNSAIQFVTNSTTDIGTYNSTADQDTSRGIEIEPNVDLAGIEVEISSQTGSFTDLVLTDSNSNIIAEDSSGHTGGDVVTLSGTLTAGNKYYVGAYDNGASYTYAYDSVSYPVSSTTVDVTAGAFYIHPDDGGGSLSTTTGSGYTITKVTGLVDDPTSGDSLISTTNGIPEALEQYQTVFFGTSPDGETVTLDIEDSNGNVLLSDIDSGTDLSSIDTSKEVQVRVNLSRTDTTNNPTLDWVEWWWTREHLV